jgi:1,4-dihydroxy-2-naphthoate polyprenyltransferase
VSNLKFLLGPMRLPFLTLPPVCVLLGVGTASWTQGKINVWYALIAFVGALASHISVNALNEYFDFRSGLDSHTRPTPFSGGSGTLPAHPEAARGALITGLVTLAIAAVVGIFFVTVWGWELLPLGILGLALLVIYTPWITRFPFLCLIAPGLGFGTFMVMGTDFVLTGHYSWTAFFASLVPFFLVSNLLLLNQFPDADADRTVGRRHYPITIGRKKASIIYGAFVVGAYLAIVVGWLIGVLPWPSLLCLLTLYVGVRCIIGAYRYADEIDKLIPYLAQNVILNITMPLLTAIGLLIA